MTETGEHLIKGLNKDQADAVLSTSGPNMIIAGAGSGKTKVITHRLAYILDRKLADSFNVLSLTFTNKAAMEMRERIEKLIGPEAKNLWMGTFHSIFARILRVDAQKLGYTNAFTIYDSEDSVSLIKTILKELNLDDKTYKPKSILSAISNAKNYLIDAEEFENKYVLDDLSEKASKVFRIYTNRCFQANAMDFDDLLVKPIELFEKFPEVLHKLQHRFKYIMVDEFQDTNFAQYLITRKLAAVHENICVVGDDAQSIYSFRGANIQNILNFAKDYPDTKVFKLEQNYRSTGIIVQAANEIILNNKDQIQKTVFTKNESGDLIRIIEAETDLTEAMKVCDLIREQKQVLNLFNKDFAILYRNNAQSRAIEDALRKTGIAYRIYGGLSFYQRKEIKDIVAYLRLSINQKDEEALKRVINYPVRGIGNTTLTKLLTLASEKNVPLGEIVFNIDKHISGRTSAPLREFAKMIENFTEKAEQFDAFTAADYISKSSGVLKDLHSDNTVEGLSRYENVQELLNGIREFCLNEENEDKSLRTYLSSIALDTTQNADSEEDKISLMTIHSAKGLEFPSVFVMGMEEELFPNSMSVHSRADLEEERRLFYVAVTRAMKRLCLSFCKVRFKYGTLHSQMPSRFLREVNPALVHTLVKEKQSEILKNFVRPQPLRAVVNPLPVSETSFPEIIGDDLSDLAEGMLVEHHKFGKGKVLSLEGSATEKKATIIFADKGQKVLLLKYARLKILS